MKRKMTADDRRILADVVSEIGVKWTLTALAVIYRAAPHSVLKRWTDKRLAAWKFLVLIVNDYAMTAIENALQQIVPDTEGTRAAYDAVIQEMQAHAPAN